MRHPGSTRPDELRELGYDVSGVGEGPAHLGDEHHRASDVHVERGAGAIDRGEHGGRSRGPTHAMITQEPQYSFAMS